MQSFQFQPRVGKINWRKIADVDLSLLSSTVNVDLLQELIENITFADVTESDLSYFTDSYFLKLFRIAQLTIEYLLFVQNFLSTSFAETNEKLQKVVESESALKLKLSESESVNQTIVRDLKYYRKLAHSLEIFHGGANVQGASSQIVMNQENIDPFVAIVDGKGRSVFVYDCSSFCLQCRSAPAAVVLFQPPNFCFRTSNGVTLMSPINWLVCTKFTRMEHLLVFLLKKIQSLLG